MKKFVFITVVFSSIMLASIQVRAGVYSAMGRVCDPNAGCQTVNVPVDINPPADYYSF